MPTRVFGFSDFPDEDSDHGRRSNREPSHGRRGAASEDPFDEQRHGGGRRLGGHEQVRSGPRHSSRSGPGYREEDTFSSSRDPRSSCHGGHRDSSLRPSGFSSVPRRPVRSGYREEVTFPSSRDPRESSSRHKNHRDNSRGPSRHSSSRHGGRRPSSHGPSGFSGMGELDSMFGSMGMGPPGGMGRMFGGSGLGGMGGMGSMFGGGIGSMFGGGGMGSMFGGDFMNDPFFADSPPRSSSRHGGQPPSFTQDRYGDEDRGRPSPRQGGRRSSFLEDLYATARSPSRDRGGRSSSRHGGQYSSSRHGSRHGSLVFGDLPPSSFGSSRSSSRNSGRRSSFAEAFFTSGGDHRGGTPFGEIHFAGRLPPDSDDDSHFPSSRIHSSRRHGSSRLPPQPVDIRDAELMDVPVVATGSRIRIQDFTRPVQNPPADVDACAICMAHEGGQQLITPRVCEHTFHPDCLEHWANSGANNSATCPTCRKVICGERPLVTQINGREIPVSRYHDGDDDDEDSEDEFGSRS